MYKEANVLNKDKVIEFIKTGHVRVRNDRDAQVYDIYYGGDKNPTASFENNWGMGEFVLYVNNQVVSSFNYANTPEYKTVDKYKELASVLGACVERCRQQAQIDMFENIANAKGSPNKIADYRKCIFSKFINFVSKSK